MERFNEDLGKISKTEEPKITEEYLENLGILPEIVFCKNYLKDLIALLIGFTGNFKSYSSLGNFVKISKQFKCLNVYFTIHVMLILQQLPLPLAPSLPQR